MQCSGDSVLEAVELVDRPWFPYLCTEIENWRWETHGDPHYNLWACLEGNGSLECGGVTYRLQPGVFFIFSPGLPIVARHLSGPRVTRFSAHFHPFCRGGRSGRSVLSPMLGHVMPDVERLRRCVDAIMRVAVQRKSDGVLAEAVRALLEELMARGEAGLGQRLDPEIGEAVHHLQEPEGSEGSIAALAARLGLSRSHFDRKFRNQVGMPPKRFLLHCRTMEAKRLLESSQLRVGEVADALGYRDVYFFSRQFKAATGHSPTAFRRSIR